MQASASFVGAARTKHDLRADGERAPLHGLELLRLLRCWVSHEGPIRAVQISDVAVLAALCTCRSSVHLCSSSSWAGGC